MEEMKMENEIKEVEVMEEKMNVNWKDVGVKTLIGAAAMYGIGKGIRWCINKWNAHKNKNVVTREIELDEKGNEK